MRRSFEHTLLGLVATCALGALGTAAVACGSFTSTEPAVDGGSDGDADGTSGDASVDPCVDTPTAPSCLDEATALFVSGSASGAGGDGTREKPFATVNAALSAVTSEKRRIYVCEGTYAEDLALDAKHSGVSVLGGVTCAWEPSGTKPVLGASATPLHIESANGLAFVDVAVEAKNATEGSSIAAFVHGGSVTFKGVRLVAGKGAKGAEGVLAPFSFPAQAALNGNDAPDENTGGAERSVACPGDAVTKGGRGGNPGFQGDDGTPGGTPNKGAVATCGAGGTGGDGAAGPAAIAGDGAATRGELTETSWMPGPGADGPHGPPGQGGGGGYGNAGAGGGGGAGGCGGAAGPGGSGGGASIALAVHESAVALSGSELHATDAGNGGKGAAGQAGQTQFGFGGNKTGGACNGGNGGPGGAGGAGGGGAGGVSVGVLYSGTKPTLDSATEEAITVGKAGSGGAGGAADNGGVDGQASAVLEAR
jgi:hypothetical protein